MLNRGWREAWGSCTDIWALICLLGEMAWAAVLVLLRLDRPPAGRTLQERYPAAPDAFVTHYSSVELPDEAFVKYPRRCTAIGWEENRDVTHDETVKALLQTQAELASVKRTLGSLIAWMVQSANSPLSRTDAKLLLDMLPPEK